MTEIKNTENLLSQVQTIDKSYERLNEANGGNFNIFSILRMESDEVRTHSRFIAELLNPRGVHGFKDEFLKQFIEIIDGKKKDDDKTKLDTKKCSTNVEVSVGKINKDYTEGGSIDILIQDDLGNVIMIENKIYAHEQHNQLLRYKNAYPNGDLLYLTLWGSASEQGFPEDEYIKISYQNEILAWLDECKKISVDNPTLRETIKQYSNLIRKLTNQNINKEMNEELLKLIIKNEENIKSANQISATLNNCTQILLNKLDLIINKADDIKIKYDDNEIVKEIKLLQRFTYKQSQIIRIDILFKGSIGHENCFIYEIEKAPNSYFLNTKLWGVGSYFEKFEKEKNELSKKLKKEDIVYDEDPSSVIEKIDANILQILGFLQND